MGLGYFLVKTQLFLWWWDFGSWTLQNISYCKWELGKAQGSPSLTGHPLGVASNREGHLPKHGTPLGATWWQNLHSGQNSGLQWVTPNCIKAPSKRSPHLVVPYPYPHFPSADPPDMSFALPELMQMNLRGQKIWACLTWDNLHSNKINPAQFP